MQLSIERGDYASRLMDENPMMRVNDAYANVGVGYREEPTERERNRGCKCMSHAVWFPCIYMYMWSCDLWWEGGRGREMSTLYALCHDSCPNTKSWLRIRAFVAVTTPIPAVVPVQSLSLLFALAMPSLSASLSRSISLSLCILCPPSCLWVSLSLSLSLCLLVVLVYVHMCLISYRCYECMNGISLCACTSARTCPH